jgi:hypothetical protein
LSQQVEGMNCPLGPHCFAERASRSGLYRRSAARLDKFWRLLRGHEAKPSVFGEVEGTEFGIADTDGLLQHRRENWLEVASGRGNNL